MRKFISCVFFCALAAVSAMGQKLDTLYISDAFTTHLRFTSELVYADISNPDCILAAIVENKKTNLAVKAAAPFDGIYNLTVIEADEEMHTFIVRYTPKPYRLIYDYRAGVGDSASVPVPAVQTGARSASGGSLRIEDIYAMPRKLYHLGNSAYGITVQCENMVVNNDMLFFTVSVTNDSGISYSIEDAVFKVESRRSGRRDLAVSDMLTPKNQYGSLSAQPGQVSRKCYSFPKFTLTKDQVFNIYFHEDMGQRDLVIGVGWKDINGVR